jgi:hypothetical protein
MQVINLRLDVASTRSVRGPRQWHGSHSALAEFLKYDESKSASGLNFVADFPAPWTRQATCFAQEMHHLNKPHMEITSRGPGLQRHGFAPAGKQTKRV